MGFLDFLKGILPDTLLKIDNRQIIIRDSEIIFGDQNINDPEIISKFFEKIKTFKDKNSLPFQLIHKDLKDDYLQYESISIEQKEYLKVLKEVLSLDDVECIMMARRVYLAFKDKEVPLAQDLKNQLDKNYPRKGRKVFNLMTAGYFDDLILPMINVLKLQDPVKYIQKFKSFYEDILRFFPIAIFVNNETTESMINKQINQRLKLKTIPFIRIHSMGENNIRKVENIIKNLDSEDKCRFSVENNQYLTPNGVISQVTTIKIAKNFY